MTSNKINDFFKDMLSFENEDEILEFKVDQLQLKTVNKILKIMKTRNISQKELAEKIKTSSSYISQVFSSDKPLSLKTIVKIQEALNIKVDINFNDKKLKYNTLPSDLSFNVENKNKIVQFLDYKSENKKVNNTASTQTNIQNVG